MIESAPGRPPNQSIDAPKRVALVGNTSWGLFNFRLGLIRRLRAEGHEVVAIAPTDDYSDRLAREVSYFEPLTLDRRGTNPIRDYLTYRKLLGIYASRRTDFVFHYTVKPNILGTLAAAKLGIPSVAIITGLGHLYTHKSWKTRVATALYRRALRPPRAVWFLNAHDAEVFIEKGIVKESQVGFLPGEGIDTERFRRNGHGSSVSDPGHSAKEAPDRFSFLLAGRLTEEKGVRDYVSAARILREQGVDAEFQLLGFFEPDSVDDVNREEVAAWESEGLVRFLGDTDDVRPHIQRANCVVLPTFYREGIPRILLEAASMETPIISTDTVGCNEVVEDGVTGLFCEPRNPTDIARVMRRMIDLPDAERQGLGINGRRRVLSRFDEKLVLAMYLETLNRSGQPNGA